MKKSEATYLKCCLCQKEIRGPKHPHTDEYLFAKGEFFGHNPYPLVALEDYESRCCCLCDFTKVIPARLGMNVLSKDREEIEKITRWGLGLMEADKQARKMAFEAMEPNIPTYINKDDPNEQLDPLGNVIGRFDEQE